MCDIPDGEILYRYAKPEAFPKDQHEIPAGIFNDKNLSCDWAKYQNRPDDSFHVAQGKSFIISITVCDEIRNPKNPKGSGQIVDDCKQKIFHNPISQEEYPINGANPAHSLIQGKKRPVVTDAIRENSTWRKANSKN